MPDSTIIQADWPAPSRVHALTTTRRLPGNSPPPFDAFNLGLRSGEDESTVRANRVLLERAFALPSSPRWLHQVHGDRVLRLTSEVLDGEPQADAAFTSAPGVVLVILTADCLPILVCADDGSEIAAIHAGWRGLAAGVIDACVRRMATPPARLLAWLGPGIGAASYEVGVEVREVLLRHDAAAETAFAPTHPGHWLCDLYALARRRLSVLGVARVFGGGIDSCADPRFYSHRRDGARSGRMASLIWIAASPESA
ncbi:MAG: peptidoglycan editing factor PgeF [Xanthomonadaceae bacterium]|nr:peptidoglycan editing factor PgeF [Xanthomonadaceae bacterium]MDE1962166.1 peptidoglycan editing factor PgeF [Xanthomonadaceae bacterium]MDE2084782.1 peptidoglycan editing factor PgeF [Xanthomonadaceae bacterium]MDE2257413.1 peptidoglycan editing factor PgeF [Xanthomonadaceae bacterium]